MKTYNQNDYINLINKNTDIFNQIMKQDNTFNMNDLEGKSNNENNVKSNIPFPETDENIPLMGNYVPYNKYDMSELSPISNEPIIQMENKNLSNTTSEMNKNFENLNNILSSDLLNSIEGNSSLKENLNQQFEPLGNQLDFNEDESCEKIPARKIQSAKYKIENEEGRFNIDYGKALLENKSNSGIALRSRFYDINLGTPENNNQNFNNINVNQYNIDENNIKDTETISGIDKDILTGIQNLNLKNSNEQNKISIKQSKNKDKNNNNNNNKSNNNDNNQLFILPSSKRKIEIEPTDVLYKNINNFFTQPETSNLYQYPEPINININNNYNNYNSISINNPPIFSSNDSSKFPKDLPSNSNNIFCLMKKVDENPEEVCEVYYPQIMENFYRMVSDKYGSFLIRKILPRLSLPQIFNILKQIEPYFCSIGCNAYGSHVIQDTIPLLKNVDLQTYFFSIMKPNIISLLYDINGTYIVQKFEKKYLSFQRQICKIVTENCLELSVNKHGCCVIEGYLRTLTGKKLDRLLDKLISNCLFLLVDPFGNFIIQEILSMNVSHCNNRIGEQIANNLCFFAKNKYSSKAVERSFDHCTGEVRIKLINTALNSGSIPDLLLDVSGNYILQKVIRIVDPKTQREVLNEITKYFDQLLKLPFGANVIKKLISNYSHFTEFSNKFYEFIDKKNMLYSGYINFTDKNS